MNAVASARKRDYYEFFVRDGFHVKGDPNAIGRELALLAKETKDKKIDAARVVERARDPNSALHEHIFGETQAEAAHQRRLQLARELCRAIECRRVVNGRPGDRVRLLMPVPNTEQKKRAADYMLSTAWVEDDVAVAATMAMFYRELLAVFMRYKHYELHARMRERIGPEIEKLRKILEDAGVLPKN